MMTYLVYLAIVLAIVAIAQIVRIYELSSELKGDKQYEVNDADNRLNARLMLGFMFAFFAFCVWQVVKYKDKLLPVAASEEGKQIDWLMDFNMLIITIVFFITNALLFYFAYKYKFKKGTKATYYTDNHKLELLWTTIPGLVLAVVIFLGLKTWNNIQREIDGEDYLLIEVYAKQFDWTARYAGVDNKLGEPYYRNITDANPLGVDSMDERSKDDFLIRNELHIPKGKQIRFIFRSRDVIHSAYFPHFRQQMNAVPGMKTQLHFVPTISTAEMRDITKNPDFNYILLCNKICGASHYNMQMNIVVDEPADYQKWYAEKAKAILFFKATAQPATSGSVVDTTKKVNDKVVSAHN